MGPALSDVTPPPDSDEAAGALTLIEDPGSLHRLTPGAEEVSDAGEPEFRHPIDLAAQRRLTAHFDEAITRLVDMQSESARSGWLRSAAGARAFAQLAGLGFDAYDALVGDLVRDDRARLRAVTDAALVHLAVFDAGEGHLALELLYDREAPDTDGGWCAGFDEALATGACPHCLPWDPDVAVDSPVPVCPTGFWGVRKRIERVLLDTPTPETAATLSSAVAPGGGVLTDLDDVCIGVADRVDSAASDGTKPTTQMLAALEDALGTAPALIRDWDAWRQAVADSAPQLLVLLTHTDDESLELGASQFLHRQRIKTADVRVPGGENGPGPLVVLLGCDTTSADALNSFVGTFRSRGAAVVVGTLGTTLGRFAAPIAGQLITLLNDPDGPASVGAALTAIRRRTLAEGWVTGLLVTAFGDASHPIAKEG